MHVTWSTDAYVPGSHSVQSDDFAPQSSSWCVPVCLYTKLIVHNNCLIWGCFIFYDHISCFVVGMQRIHTYWWPNSVRVYALQNCVQNYLDKPKEILLLPVPLVCVMPLPPLPTLLSLVSITHSLMAWWPSLGGPMRLKTSWRKSSSNLWEPRVLGYNQGPNQSNYNSVAST